MSCTKDNEQFIVDINLELSVNDTTGNDLLNPENPHSFAEETINNYYKTNEGKVLMFNGDLTHPKGFFIYEHDSEYRICLYLYADRNVEFPVAYIEWINSDIDTVRYKIDRTSDSEICKKIWFNDKLAWADNSKPRYIQIIK